MFGFRFSSVMMVIFCFFINVSMVFYSTASMALSSSEKLLVFVHGAHLTGKSWGAVEDLLSEKGVETLSVNLPGREDSTGVTLDVSSRYLCGKINGSSKPIAFVVHSQGGAVVHHALRDCAKSVEEIIYIAAVAPLDGEKPFAMLSKADDEHYFKGVEYRKKEGLMKISNPEVFAQTFSSLDDQVINKKVLEDSVSEPSSIGDGVVDLNNELLKGIGKSYIFTEKDKIISLSSQYKIADKLGIERREFIASGHVPMISHPKELSDVIFNLVNH